MSNPTKPTPTDPTSNGLAVRERIAAVASELARDPDEASNAIVARILDAASVDDVFGASDTTTAQEVLGVGLRINGLSLGESSYDGGLPAYAVLDAVDIGTGKSLTVTCGAASVVAQLIKLHQLGAFPIDVVLRESEHQTARGYRPMALHRFIATDGEPF